ncbi:MAG TPA: integrase core domain-containing protein [Candidatus Bathyarchaeia archaeon]|nr:integrase core domain-containing protein [Candidatus Bathyarchaeia archaeon]
MKTLNSSLAFESSDVAKFRFHVLQYYYKWGLRPTLDAFRVKKSTLYDWKKVYEESGKRLVSLVPKSTRPHHTRKMLTDFRLTEFIKQIRLNHGNVGANIIKPFLYEYARKEDLASISKSTIEKLIKRRHFTFEKRVNYRRKTKYTKLRVKKPPKVKKPGFIQIDSIIIYINQERHLFISVIDIFTKFALVEKVDSLSSLQARETFKKYQKISPTPIHTVQTDNGSEFLAKFHGYLEEQGIKHQFIYPRLVKVNAVIERFNRTIQEEFIKRSDEIYYDLEIFSRKLIKYLYWYNHKRPHWALNYLSPIQFINSKIPESR